MNNGDLVSVYKEQVFNSPHFEWCGGYVFLRQEHGEAVLKRTSGLFEGVECRYPIEHVKLLGD